MNAMYLETPVGPLTVWEQGGAIVRVDFGKTAAETEKTALLAEAEKFLPEGDRMYPEDMYTDRTLRFMAAEIIREKALYLLDKEVPYGIGVHINKFEFRKDKPICDIDADVVCEKQSHKAIVIGKGGGTLKKISTAAREDIEELVGCKVFLTLYVRVKNEWRDSDYLMRELGYDVKDLKD